ncbi:hypothetical protein ACFYWY_35650 [Streptomyces sp. NPDC002870]
MVLGIIGVVAKGLFQLLVNGVVVVVAASSCSACAWGRRRRRLSR